MQIEHVPLLKIARELYDVPRGMERFRAYLQTITSGPEDVILPLVALNPMGREHVVAALDALLALDAERIAAAAVEEAGSRLRQLAGELRVGIALADDIAGGWTHRPLTDMHHRFDLSAALKHQWATALFWASDTPTAITVRAETLSTIYRSAHALRHGVPTTLRQMMVQEGQTARFAGIQPPDWSSGQIAAIRQIIEPHLEATETPVTFACLYGDDAAREVGYPALGLPPSAGLGLAIREAYARDAAPNPP